MKRATKRREVKRATKRREVKRATKRREVKRGTERFRRELLGDGTKRRERGSEDPGRFRA